MNPRYQEWLTHVFDHEVEYPQSYFTPDAPKFVAEPGEIVELLGQTFLHAGRDLIEYSDAQVGQGIWYMVSVGGSDFILSWCDQNRTGLCDQKRNKALAQLQTQLNTVISWVASAEDRALRGRNLSAV